MTSDELLNYLESWRTRTMEGNPDNRYGEGFRDGVAHALKSVTKELVNMQGEKR